MEIYFGFLNIPFSYWAEATRKTIRQNRSYLLDCYYNGYLGTLYDIHVQGIPLIFPIEQEQVLKAFTIDIKLSKKIYERLGD